MTFESRRRRLLAVLCARVVGAASRSLKRGAGTSLPGLIAERIDPRLVRDLGAQLAFGSVVITGTNGKTTTARMIAEVLEAHGFVVVRNRAGANMIRGLATSLVETADWRGRVPRAENSIGVFEVDEAFLPDALEQLRPRRVVLLNVFRDQLDRYGEVANIRTIWREPLKRLTAQAGFPDSTVIANADDPLVAEVALDSARVSWFGLDLLDQGTPDHGGDVKTCPRCGGPIVYSRRYYGHLGEYSSACGFERPRPELVATGVELQGLEGSLVNLGHDGKSKKVILPLPGLYNVTNAAAAAATALSLGVSLDTVASALAELTSAFGRMERFEANGRVAYLLLAKNPTGYNQVLRTVFASPDEGAWNVLFLLNDNAADGRDVSWIWDVDFERLKGRLAYVGCAGTRAEDMALRLKYAAVTAAEELVERTFHSSADAFEALLQATPAGHEMYIFATYTAMLDVRGLITKLGFAAPYWER
jgi:lipid II isoglutaminyl synthase (glutamine-hydrolysing)